MLELFPLEELEPFEIRTTIYPQQGYYDEYINAIYSAQNDVNDTLIERVLDIAFVLNHIPTVKLNSSLNVITIIPGGPEYAWTWNRFCIIVQEICIAMCDYLYPTALVDRYYNIEQDERDELEKAEAERYASN